MSPIKCLQGGGQQAYQCFAEEKMGEVGISETMKSAKREPLRAVSHALQDSPPI